MFMTDLKKQRRQFLKDASLGLGGLYLPSLLKTRQKIVQKKKVVCVGGHPDDPESGCGGSLARFANSGHDVTIIYLTTGEAGIEGKSHIEAASIRKQEAISACEILNARPVFAGQIDGDTIVNNEWVRTIKDLINSVNPDFVFTHWPLDSHKDHQVASLLSIQAWMQTKIKWQLYFFEVCAGEQTVSFQPTDYIDISDTKEQKRKAVYCHKSQDPESIYACGHAVMEEFRGREAGVRAAEAFVRMNGKATGWVLP